MAIHSVDDLHALINQQTQVQEALGENLLKLKALVNVALGEGFFIQEPATLYHYFWAMSDVLSEASQLNQQGLKGLLSVM